ncbi:MAG: c-type cytochrome biogenesis protein CcmI [Minwuia sp.]|uniref:c-type cytochrome biogenesis protein CcmI n=1 Tax=Minwuia sp. TaxID=2493630 RepID=UPI003A89D7F8
MSLWILIAAITVAAAVYILRPLARAHLSAARRGDYDLRVYQSQIEDLDSDVARGVMTEAEARGARNEIERRMLQAVRDHEPEIGTAGRSNAIIGILVALALPVAAGLIYLEIGRPDLPSQPLAERTDVPANAGRMTASAGGGNNPAQTQDGLASVDQMVGSLEQRLEENPQDFDGWMLLGRSYNVMERYGDAVRAYEKAVSLPEAEGDTAPHMQLGESLIFASGGVVPEEAQEAFQKVLSLDQGHPGARYYIALARGQAGDLQAAYDGWMALAKDSPSDAPWMEPLRARLQEVAADLDVELPDPLPTLPAEGAPAMPELPPLPQASAESGGAEAPSAPGPTAEQMQAAQDMSSEDRQAMIQGMVERLAGRLEEEPDDYDGWMRLGRAYGVTGNQQGAIEAYGNAVRLRPQDPQTRLQYAIAVQDAAPDGPMPPESVAAFQALADVAPENPDALFMLGRADAEAGRPEDALQKWRKLLGMLQPGTPAWQGVDAQIRRLEEAGK